MFRLSIIAITALLALSEAKTCTNVTIPVSISARNALFSLEAPTTNLGVTTIAQHFTAIGGNYTETIFTGYNTTTGNYNISAKYCTPSNGSQTSNSNTVQFLTHGIGFDKTYWDLAYNNYNYSYTDVAVDKFGYSTLAIDRLGIGNSSHGDPMSVIQAPAEMSAIYEITMMLRKGSIPGLTFTAPEKIVHVGHSFGSALSYLLAAMYPTGVTDGLILTGYSANSSYLPITVGAWNLQLACLNQPFRFGGVELSTFGAALAQYNPTFDLLAGISTSVVPSGPVQNLANGYITWSDIGSNQFAFLAPGYFDPALAPYTEMTKQPLTIGELLTIGGAPKTAMGFKGPVYVVTGEKDAIYCGGDCYATGGVASSIPAMASMQFPNTTNFETLIQPGAGHAVNVHYNSTAAFTAIQMFLQSNEL